MLDKLKLMIVKKYLLGYLVSAYQALDGNKTQIIIGVAALVWGAARLHYISPDQEQNAYKVIGGSGGITFLAKLDKWKNLADELGNAVQKESKNKGEIK